MKPKSALRSFLAITGSSLLAISYSHGQTILADSYLPSLSVASPTTVSSSLNFPSYLDGPLTGSSTLTHTGLFGSILYLANNGAGNTFDGNITVDSGTLRTSGSPFATTTGGFTAPSMTSGDTITINRAGTLYIDDNATNGYTADRFGSASNRPLVNLTGSLTLNGRNNAAASPQTFGALTAGSGLATINVIRNSGTPSLEFPSLTQTSGSVLSFNDSNTSTLGTAATGVPQVKFAATPANLINGILAGAKYHNGGAGNGDFVTYGANGVTKLTAYTDYALNDINAAGSTENVRMTGTAAAVALSGDKTINSLHFTGTGSTWNLGNKLTLTSGMFMRSGNNSLLTIGSGTLTAGDGVNDIDLHIMAQQQNITISGTTVIADNSATAVTLVKSEASGNTLSLSGNQDNTYTGGTYVLNGTLSTGNVANRAYLGTGKATANGGNLSLGNIGATSNSTGDDFTAINGGKISISNNNHGSVDTFNIAAGSAIGGSSGSGTGLASLTRGTNITLAAGAIISPGNLSAALNLTTGMIQNIGTSADLYFGLSTDQNNSAGQITIGSGTAFRGVSTDRSVGGKGWQQGIINIASGTTSVDFQGDSNYNIVTLTLGNGTTAGAPVINFAGSGTVDINAIGSLTLNDDTATYGNTGATQNIRFVATAGSTLTVTPATGMGSGTGIASALVKNGGLLAIGNAAALNGNVTVEAGGQFNANQASGLTGTGTLTFNEGSILNITGQALGFSGTQASGASIAAGTLVKLNVSNFGAAGTTLDSVLGSGSKNVSYIYNGNSAVNPTSPGTAVYTLNRSSGGGGGVLTGTAANHTVGNLTNGNITLGANGGVIAATTGTTFTIQENITGAGSLTVGTTAIIDGLPKLGKVSISTTTNDYTGGTIVNAGTLSIGATPVLGSTSGQLTINTGGTLDLTAQSPTVGNLTGTGGVITSTSTSGTRTLTIGQGDNGGGNFQGSIQNGAGGANALIKTGTGAITLSGNNTYTGTTAINVGKLFINGDQSTATGNVTVAANATLGGTGTIGGTTTIADTGKLEFNLSTAPGSHDKLELASGKTMTFSGGSTLTITSSGGATTGLYKLVTALGGTTNITGLVPATVNLPSGWTADAPQIIVDGSDTSLVINITSTGGGGPGPLDHFAISAISSPQTVGTPITGITLTAQDASNATVTSFTGTVSFGGTGGFTGTSAAFIAGVLSGVSVTPTVAGSGLTFTVTDGVSGKTGSATITTIQTQYQAWSGGAAFDADANGDGVKNGLAFLLGASGPNVSALNKLPTVTQSGGNLVLSFQCLNDASRGSASLNVEHSNNLGISDAWLAAPVTDAGSPLNNVSFSVSSASATLNNVTATVSNTEAAAGKLFGRLKANP